MCRSTGTARCTSHMCTSSEVSTNEQAVCLFPQSGEWDVVQTAQIWGRNPSPCPAMIPSLCRRKPPPGSTPASDDV